MQFNEVLIRKGITKRNLLGYYPRKSYSDSYLKKREIQCSKDFDQ